MQTLCYGTKKNGSRWGAIPVWCIGVGLRRDRGRRRGEAEARSIGQLQDFGGLALLALRALDVALDRQGGAEVELAQHGDRVGVHRLAVQAHARSDDFGGGADEAGDVLGLGLLRRCRVGLRQGALGGAGDGAGVLLDGLLGGAGAGGCGLVGSGAVGGLVVSHDRIPLMLLDFETVGFDL